MIGFMIAGLGSGSGKTSLAFGLTRYLARLGFAVQTIKFGPDYIDGQYLQIASRRTNYNIDLWAMTPSEVQALLAESTKTADILLIESAMGLFDRPLGSQTAPKDLALALNIPILLIVDSKGSAGTSAQIVRALSMQNPELKIAGVVYNNVTSARHRALILEQHDEQIAVGFLPKLKNGLGSRHLGLELIGELNGEDLAEEYADFIAQNLGPKLLELTTAKDSFHTKGGLTYRHNLPPLGRRIAIARDNCFSFIYAHQILSLKNQGVEISYFSPLANQAPDERADVVFLPGGYPELYGHILRRNRVFLRGVQSLAQKGALIYGECGGYMVMGARIISAKGKGHNMLGLLPHTSDFSTRKLSLSYHHLRMHPMVPVWGGMAAHAHEFHYSQTLPMEFENQFAMSEGVGMGIVKGNCFGSYAHII